MSITPRRTLLALLPPVAALAFATAAPAGTVSFGPPVSTPVGDFPMQAATLDLNGDAFPDLATANQNSDGLTLLVNDGGAFVPFATIPLAGSARRLVVGDLNGDLVGDLVVAFIQEPALHVAVLLGEGGGAFAAPVYYGTMGASDRVLLHDVEGDLDLDVIVSERPMSQIRVYRNQGNGTLDAPEVYVVSESGSYPGELALADVNGDLVMDLVSAAPLTAEPASYLLGAPDGTFGAPIYLVTNPGGSVSVDAGDLDGDGDTDLAIVDFFGVESLWIFFNDGAGNWSNPVTYSPGISASLNTRVRLHDLDGSGSLDAIVMPFSGGRVTYLLNDGTGKLAEPVEVLTGGSSSSFLLADFDGNNDPDLVVTDHINDLVWMLANTTATSVAVSANDSGAAFRVLGPNPMRGGGTTLGFSLARESHARVAVYDVMGRRVRTLLDQTRAVGAGQVFWDGRDDAGRRLGSGVYFARFDGDGAAFAERLTVVR